MEFKIIKLNTRPASDPRSGELLFVEGERDIPFIIKRVYCIYSADKCTQRGYHAHKKNWQLLYCPFGDIEIILKDGKNREFIELDEPSKGLIVSPGLWHEMVWKEDNSVLCVMASEYYDENDYIRSYDEYLRYIQCYNSKGNIV